MKAYVTSIGEPTTELCKWSLERNGFDVLVIKDSSTLAEKLKYIYQIADDDFIRVDADVIVNRNCTQENIRRLMRDHQYKHAVWLQFTTFDWLSQDLAHGGVQLITRQALSDLRSHVHEAINKERPESYMYRIDAFQEPRVCLSHYAVMGLHGYGQTDLQRIKDTKSRRGQYDNYDWEIVDKLGEI